jgi:chromosome segregation ATPase
MNHQYKQIIQTIKIQHTKIKSLENELSEHKVKIVKFNNDKQILISKVKELEEKNYISKNDFELQKNKNELETTKINEMNTELVEKSCELKCANEKLNEMNTELAAKTSELECANKKINEMSAELAAKTSELECANKKINEMTAELASKSTELECANEKLNEMNAELASKSTELECANEKLNEVNAELASKSVELECANKKINEMTADLDKRNDTLYQIDKIILRNNDYFDEIKKELNHKIECSKEITELYEKTNDELLRVRNEMELLCKELDATKMELQLYKNDFILKTATF